MNQQLDGVKVGIPSILGYMLSGIVTRKGLRQLFLVIMFEILRHRLPAMMSIIRCFLLGEKQDILKTGEPDKLHQKEEQVEELKEQKGKSDNRLNILSQQLKTKEAQHRRLEKIQSTFFKKNWSEHAKRIHEEIISLFNIEILLGEVNRNLNIEKKSQQWEVLKREVFCFVPFSVVTSTLLICTQFLHEVLRQKYSDSLSKDYPALDDAQEICGQILNEFFEQIQLVGMKNIKAFFKQKLPKNLHDLPITQSFHFESVFTLLDEYFLSILLRGNSSLKKPSDHKKRNSMTLFRNGRRKTSPGSCLPPVNFTDFNEIVHLHSGLQQYAHVREHEQTDSNNVLFAHEQPIVVPNAMLDIMFLFLGDIIDNKVLTDTEFIEKHIEISDCKCREQRYQPSLQCIPEADDDGYESDKSDTPMYRNKYKRSEYARRHHSSSSRLRKYSSEKDTTKQHRKLSDGVPRVEDFLKDTTKQHRKLSDGVLRVEDLFKDTTKSHRKFSDGVSRIEDFLKDKTPYQVGDDDYYEEEAQSRETHQNRRRRQDSKSKEVTLRIEEHPDNFGMSLFKHRGSSEDADQEEDDAHFKSLRLQEKQYRFLSQLDGDEEDYVPSQPRDEIPFASPWSSDSPKNSTNSRSQYLTQMELDQQNHDNIVYNHSPQQNNLHQQQHLDEEEIMENRMRLSHFLQGLCFEALEMLESTNFQSYLYYAILFQYKKLKNRFRLSVSENNLNKNMTLLNIIVQLNKLIEEHILSEDAPSKCDQIYSKYKMDAEHVLRNGTSHPSSTHNCNIQRIFEEMEQSRIIRESFDQLTHFFISS